MTLGESGLTSCTLVLLTYPSRRKRYAYKVSYKGFGEWAINTKVSGRPLVKLTWLEGVKIMAERKRRFPEAEYKLEEFPDD